MRNKKLFFLAIPILLILTAFSVPNRAADTDESGNEDGALSTSSDDTYYILNSSIYEIEDLHRFTSSFYPKNSRNDVYSDYSGADNYFIINKTSPDQLYNMSSDLLVPDYKNNFTFRDEEKTNYTDSDNLINAVDFVRYADLSRTNDNVAILDEHDGRSDVIRTNATWIENYFGTLQVQNFNSNISTKMWLDNNSQIDLSVTQIDIDDMFHEGPTISVDFDAGENTIIYNNGTTDMVLWNGTESISEQWLDVEIELDGSKSGSGTIKTTVILESGTALLDGNETTDNQLYDPASLKIEQPQIGYNYLDNIYIEPNNASFLIKDYETSTSSSTKYITVPEAYFNETDENLTCGHGFEHKFYPNYNYVNSSAEVCDISVMFSLGIPYVNWDNLIITIQVYYYEEVTIEEEECPDCPEEEDEECPSCPTCPEVPEWYEILNWEYFSLLLVFIPVLLLCGIAYIIIREATV